MSEILDEIENKPEKKGYINLISFLNGILSASIFFLLFKTYRYSVDDDWTSPTFFLICLLIVLLFSGLIFTLLSFRKRGEYVALKWIGAFFNLLPFLVLVGLLIVYT